MAEDRATVYRVAERVDVREAVPGLAREVRAYFRSQRYAWGSTVGKTVLAVCRRTSPDVFVWTSAMHGTDILGDSTERFEREFLPFILDRNECSVVQVFIGTDSPITVEAWLYVRGRDQAEAAGNMLAESVMES